MPTTDCSPSFTPRLPEALTESCLGFPVCSPVQMIDRREYIPTAHARSLALTHAVTLPCLVFQETLHMGWASETRDSIVLVK